jgi:hypothetical protein
VEGWSFDGAKNGDGMSRVGRHLGWYYLDAAEVRGGSVGSQMCSWIWKGVGITKAMGT